MNDQTPVQVMAQAALELKKRKKTAKTAAPTGYGYFQKRYENDRAGFARDCIRWDDNESAAPYQIEILGLLDKHQRVAVRGAHGLGKSTLAAWCVLHFALTCDRRSGDWKAITTASAWRQLTEYLWPEIHKWSRKLRWDIIGREPFTKDELLGLRLNMDTGRAFAVASNEAQKVEGAHAQSLMYVFDEAKIIPISIWDSIEGAFSNAGNKDGVVVKALAISTPGFPSGRFYDIHQKREGTEDWVTRHVTLKEIIAAGRIDPAWVEQRKKLWGENSAIFKNKVMGEFATDNEASIIPLEWVDAAVLRWKVWQHELRDQLEALFGVELSKVPRFEAGKAMKELLGTPTVMALDFSDGGDPGVIGVRYGMKVDHLEYMENMDSMSQVGRVVQVHSVLKPKRTIGDADGMGSSIIGRMRESNIDIHGFHAQGTVKELTDRSGELRFKNLRAAALWNLRELLDPSNGFEVMLPDDDKLKGDLTAPRRKETESTGKIQVEAKPEIRSRLGRSTDAGDNISMLFSDLIPKIEDEGESKPKYSVTMALLRAAASTTGIRR
jgi:hypothetical protein